MLFFKEANFEAITAALKESNSLKQAVAYRGRGFGGMFKPPPPPRNSEFFTKLIRISSSVENTSVTT
jgi:hypothetical protein